MNEQEIMNNYLLLLKSSVEVYVHGTLESSNDYVRDILKSGLDETLGSQARTYCEMTSYGWYTIKNVKESVVCDTLKGL